MKTKHIILFILRIAVGGMIAFAGIMKLLNAGASIEQFAMMGLNSTIFWLVAGGETLAGLGLVFGVYSQIAAAGAAIIMAGAVYYTGGTMVSPILLLIGSLVIMYTGSGKYAIKPCPVSIKDVNTAPVATTTPTTPAAEPVVPPTNTTPTSL